MENTLTIKIVQSLFTYRRKSVWSAYLSFPFPFYVPHQYLTFNYQIIKNFTIENHISSLRAAFGEPYIFSQRYFRSSSVLVNSIATN